jgi:hypothetical protein
MRVTRLAHDALIHVHLSPRDLEQLGRGEPVEDNQDGWELIVVLVPDNDEGGTHGGRSDAE